MLIPDLLDQKKLVENIKREKEQPLYPNTELWSGDHEPTPYYPNTELHTSTPLEYGGRARMGINQFMQPASEYVNQATNILPELIITALKKMGLPISGDPQKDFGTFLVYALTPNSPVEYYQTAKALLPYFNKAKQNLTAKPAYAEEVEDKPPHKMTTEELKIERAKIQGSYDDIENLIENKIDELMAKGMSFKEADDSPEVNALYQKRWIIENLELRQGYNEVLNSVKNAAPDVDAEKLLKSVFHLSTDQPTSASFAWNYFPKNVQNKEKAIKEISSFLVEDYGDKNNLFMPGVLNPAISGWTQQGIYKFLQDTLQKSERIFNAIESTFK